MKTLRITSIIALSVLFVFLVIGNIFHPVIRKLIDKTYVEIEISDETKDRIKILDNTDYHFIMDTDKHSYSPYEKVMLIAKLIKKDGNTIPMNSVIEVEMSLDGKVIKNVQGNTKQKLIYNEKEKIWSGYWYPENPSIKGDIVAKGVAYLTTPQASIHTENRFYIYEKKPKFTLKKGMAILGVDSTERISKRSILSPAGKEIDWNSIPVWLDYLYSDGVFMLGGLTKTFDDQTSLNNPWDLDKIRETKRLAEMVSGNGQTFGVWIKGLHLEGTYLERVGYQPCIYIQNNNTRQSKSIVSLMDPTRKKHLKDLFSDFVNNPGISYVGLSDIFNEKNHDIELYSQFIREYNVSIPVNWGQLKEEERLRIFANKLASPDFLKYFANWKKYYIASYLNDIIRSKPSDKAIFYYMSLSEIKETPDLFSLLFNSGVDFIVLNIKVPYSSLSQELDVLLNNPMIAQYLNRLFLSYEIDYNNLDIATYDMSAIENYVYANMKLMVDVATKHNVQGLFINDLYKAMFGKRGPYSPYEWMLGIGKSMKEYKEANGKIPLKVISLIRTFNKENGHTEILFKLANTSFTTLYNIEFELLPVLNIKGNQATVRRIPSLAPGQDATLTLSFDIVSSISKLVKKKQFVGVRYSWNNKPERDRMNKSGFIDFLPLRIKALEFENMETNK